jgi:hypothetical protein
MAPLARDGHRPVGSTPDGQPLPIRADNNFASMCSGAQIIQLWNSPQPIDMRQRRAERRFYARAVPIDRPRSVR